MTGGAVYLIYTGSATARIGLRQFESQHGVSVKSLHLIDILRFRES